MSLSKKKILFEMTGSIAAFKACAVISKLVQAGYDVKVVASPAALKFIGPATLEGLTGNPVHSDLYESGQMMDHIHLDRWADLIIVAPASANYINKVSQGIGDDLLTTLFLAHDFKKPFLIAPAMNTAMYLHPVTQKSLGRIKELGISILEAESGVLACGETGYGRLLEPEQIIKRIEEALKQSPTITNQKIKLTTAPKILVSGGGTREQIDNVRFIGNTSTGQTAAKIADLLETFGADVTYLQGQGSVSPHVGNIQSYSSYIDLKEKLLSAIQTQSFDAVVWCAAVSDFSVATVNAEKHGGKISSEKDLTLTLKKNPKLIDEIKKHSLNKNVCLIGFKLTSEATEQEVTESIQKLFQSSHADFVVHNDTKTIHKERNQHLFSLHSKKSESRMAEGSEMLAAQLFEAVQNYSSHSLREK